MENGKCDAICPISPGALEGKERSGSHALQMRLSVPRGLLKTGGKKKKQKGLCASSDMYLLD